MSEKVEKKVKKMWNKTNSSALIYTVHVSKNYDGFRDHLFLSH